MWSSASQLLHAASKRGEDLMLGEKKHTQIYDLFFGRTLWLGFKSLFYCLFSYVQFVQLSLLYLSKPFFSFPPII